MTDRQIDNFFDSVENDIEDMQAGAIFAVVCAFLLGIIVGGVWL